MITKRDMDNILKDVNRVFETLEKRVSALEKQVVENKTPTKTTTSTKTKENA